MNSKKLFLTSSGLSADMKKKFFDIIGKCPEDVKVLYIPTAGIETDGAREGFAVCFQELSSMGIRYENILVYNLELILSKDYQRTYSTCVTDPYMLTRLLTIEELQSFDAVVVSGGLVYVGISAGSMYAAGNLDDGLNIINNPIIPHWNGTKIIELPDFGEAIKIVDGQAVYVEDDCISLI